MDTKLTDRGFLETKYAKYVAPIAAVRVARDGSLVFRPSRFQFRVLDY